MAVVIAIFAIANKPVKNLHGFNVSGTHGLCASAAVLYQLSYEVPYIGNRSICCVHLNLEKE